MLQFEYHQSRAPLVIATVVALICHALFMVFALPVVLRVEPDDYKKPAKKTENQEMCVVVRSVPAKELPENFLAASTGRAEGSKLFTLSKLVDLATGRPCSHSRRRNSSDPWP